MNRKEPTLQEWDWIAKDEWSGVLYRIESMPAVKADMQTSMRNTLDRISGEAIEEVQRCCTYLHATPDAIALATPKERGNYIHRLGSMCINTVNPYSNAGKEIRVEFNALRRYAPACALFETFARLENIADDLTIQGSLIIEWSDTIIDDLPEPTNPNPRYLLETISWMACQLYPPHIMTCHINKKEAKVA